ncbi:hypothetical protein SDC9_54240 [bioreactor metagenome]|uniref:Uncharacterized protein n=1 Tax=bioreactor metagenome TaxID=1076179 RepID=A0A644WVW6_9ZZZZ
MEHKEYWKGREIQGYDPELASHIKNVMTKQFLPGVLADPERARRILKQVKKDENGNGYLADYDGNYIGPLPDWLKKTS